MQSTTHTIFALDEPTTRWVMYLTLVAQVPKINAQQSLNELVRSQNFQQKPSIDIRSTMDLGS